MKGPATRKKRKPQPPRLSTEKQAARNVSIVEDHSTGQSMKVLSWKHNLSINSISQILRNASIVARDKSDRNRSVVQGYLEGTPRHILSKKHNITEGLVYQILRNEGIPVDPDRTDRDRSIVGGYASGMSIKMLAKQHNLSIGRIEQILRREKVQLRNRYPELTGRVFSRLTVLKQEESSKTGERRWLCRCSCGNEHTVRTDGLVKNKTKSCGCLQKEGAPIKHGQCRRGRKTVEYSILANAKARAKNAGVPFSLTLEDIHIPEKCPVFGTPLKPNKGKLGPDSPSIDRLIPELGYVPGNVKVISYRANRIKQDASLEELETLVEWVKDSLDAGGHKNDPGTLTLPTYIKKYDLRKGPRSNISKISKEVSNVSEQ